MKRTNRPSSRKKCPLSSLCRLEGRICSLPHAGIQVPASRTRSRRSQQPLLCGYGLAVSVVRIFRAFFSPDVSLVQWPAPARLEVAGSNEPEPMTHQATTRWRGGQGPEIAWLEKKNFRVVWPVITLCVACAGDFGLVFGCPSWQEGCHNILILSEQLKVI